MRTRSSYDVLADDHAEWIEPELAAKPLDRALLDAFAELVRAAGTGPDHQISLDFHHRRTDHIAELATQAGLLVHAQTLRAPDNDGDFPEDTPRPSSYAAKPTRPTEHGEAAKTR